MIDIFAGSGAPLTANGITAALKRLGAPLDNASLWAVIAVETRGFGYLSDRRPKILFERHIFSQRTHGVFDANHADISNPVQGGYAGGAAEYLRLKRAMLLDRQTALESASWGLGQVMGFNASRLGYAGVQAMIDEFRASEDGQLDGCARFITANKSLQAAFLGGEWKRVAFFYNGRDFAKNAYDTKLAAFHTQFSNAGVPDVEVRAAQARLSYLGYDPGTIDGRWGRATGLAVETFQTSKSLPTANRLDQTTKAALEAAAGV